jgi:hypothetical protein
LGGFFFNAEAHRRGEIQCALRFLKVIFSSAIPYHQHPMGEDPRRQKNYHFRSFSQQSTFSLRYFAPLRLCVEMNCRF